MLLAALSGCSALTALAPALASKDGTHIAAEANIGDNKHFTVNNGSTWNELLVEHASTLLLVIVFLAFFGWLLYTLKSPQDRKRHKTAQSALVLLQNENKTLNTLIHELINKRKKDDN